MPREGHKFSSWSIRSLSTHFNPRAPRGARRKSNTHRLDALEFQSTCPARGTTRTCCRGASPPPISIHVPREGHDGRTILANQYVPAISIHVPREGHDSLRLTAPRIPANFNPRAPRGARQDTDCRVCDVCGISIHVPREGHDSRYVPARRARGRFQSTCPARGTTVLIKLLNSS